MIEVAGYHKAYGQTVAVQDLTFSVQPGAILGLVGANGAGKTTTMRAIAGIIPPTRGQLTLGGHDVVADPVAAKSLLAYIPDEPKLFEAMTVWEHLQFMAAAYRVESWEPKAEELLDKFSLTEKRHEPTQQLSRGMRQKVAICCGYLHQPAAIMFDEPHTGLDPHAIRVMTASIQERAAAGAAVIVSSHLLSLVEGVCTHLLILSSGKSLFWGTMEEARRNYPELGDKNSLEEIFFRATMS